MRPTLYTFTTIALLTAQALKAQEKKPLAYPDEKHFKNMKQLTVGGDNAEAYFGFDNEHITFQRTNPAEGLLCDQIFYGSVPTKKEAKFNYKRVSTGKGRTTCAYLMPDHKHFLYASTHLASDTCPQTPDRNKIKKYPNYELIHLLYYCPLIYIQ